MRAVLGHLAALAFLLVVVGSMMLGFVGSFILFQEVIPTGPVGAFSSGSATTIRWDGPLAPLRWASMPLAFGCGVVAMYGVQLAIAWVLSQRPGAATRWTLREGVGEVARRPKAWLYAVATLSGALWLAYCSADEPYAVTRQGNTGPVVLHTPTRQIEGARLEVVEHAGAMDLRLDGVSHRVHVHVPEARRALRDWAASSAPPESP